MPLVKKLWAESLDTSIAVSQEFVIANIFNAPNWGLLLNGRSTVVMHCAVCAAKMNVIHGYGEQIGTKLAKAEALGADGSVEESLKLMEEVEELKKMKHAAEVRQFKQHLHIFFILFWFLFRFHKATP